MSTNSGLHKDRFFLIFFMDGVGLGGDDPAVNPFVTAATPHLTAVLGADWYLAQRGVISAPSATLVPTDAGLGVAGVPQSATGQATILTGRNIPQLVGEHYGPKPNPAVAAAMRQGTLFHEVIAAGGEAALLTPYPEPYFAAIKSGRRLLSAVPLAVTQAGLSLKTAEDLQAGRAVSPDFTAAGWREHLGYPDIPELTLAAAGQQIATLARQYHFSFFEHWPSDRLGHRGTLAEAAAHITILDAVLGSLLAAWETSQGLLIITSDHGNIEDKSRRQHSKAAVPTIVAGRDHAHWAAQIADLSDIAAVGRRFLGIGA